MILRRLIHSKRRKNKVSDGLFKNNASMDLVDLAGHYEVVSNKTRWKKKSLTKIHSKSSTSISVGFLFFAWISFSFTYSKFTSRDPCEVMKGLIKNNAEANQTATATTVPGQPFPKLFHYQSRGDSTMTDEITTWKHLFLEDPNANVDVQIYPNIHTRDIEEWNMVHWTDESCLIFLQNHFPYFIETYTSFHHNIQRIDSCRYFILKQYGGIYADTDISIHAPNISLLERLIPLGAGIVESPYKYNERYQNSLMTSSMRNHPFWDTVIELIIERSGSKRSARNVLSTTGPTMLDDAVMKYYQHRGIRQGEKKESNVSPLPCEVFQRLPHGQWSETTFWNIFGREILARLVPMKGCGTYGDGVCEITRHKGRASWTTGSTLW